MAICPIALRAATYTEAEDAILARRAFGIVGIPPDTERNFLKGVTARLPIYGEFDLFHPVQPNAAGHPGIRAGRWRPTPPRLARGHDGAGVQAATAANAPVDLVMVPLFNPTASYSSYVVPAAFVLILHQTLLMGAAMLGRRRLRAGRRRRGAGRAPRPRRSSARGWRTGRSTCPRCCCISWSCRASMVSPRSAVSGRLLRCPSRSSSPPASWARPSAWCSAIVRLPCCWCSPPACRSSSWSALPGRPRQSRHSCAARASCCRACRAIDGFVRINQMGA